MDVMTIDYQDDEFFKCYSILKEAAAMYKRFIFNTKLYELESMYKNNENIFKSMKSQLISKSIDEILHKFISKYCYQTITKYLTTDFLALQLTNYLTTNTETTRERK